MRAARRCRVSRARCSTSSSPRRRCTTAILPRRPARTACWREKSISATRSATLGPPSCERWPLTSRRESPVTDRAGGGSPPPRRAKLDGAPPPTGHRPLLAALVGALLFGGGLAVGLLWMSLHPPP